MIPTSDRQYWHCHNCQQILVALLLRRLRKRTFGQYDVIPDNIALYLWRYPGWRLFNATYFICTWLFMSLVSSNNQVIAWYWGNNNGKLNVLMTVHRKQNMKREDQQDATIRCLLLTSVSTYFGHHYAHLQENKGPVTAFCVLFWFCWMWLVAVVGRYVVGCKQCSRLWGAAL